MSGKGDTMEEVVTMAKEAVEGFVEVLEKLGKPIPVERTHARQSTFNIEIKTPVRA